MPGSLGHLSARFFDVLLSKPLSTNEIRAVAHWLNPNLTTIFFDQPSEDQRHGYHAALVVISEGCSLGNVIEAALLHDVGKRHSGLGLIGRSIASVFIWLGIPMPTRMAMYRDHGVAAVSELASAGASDLSVEFARHHHGSRPPGIEPEIWNLLQLADQPPNPWSLSQFGITSLSK